MELKKGVGRRKDVVTVGFVKGGACGWESGVFRYCSGYAIMHVETLYIYFFRTLKCMRDHLWWFTLPDGSAQRISIRGSEDVDLYFRLYALVRVRTLPSIPPYAFSEQTWMGKAQMSLVVLF